VSGAGGHRYTATVAWSRGGAAFADGRYSRLHEWRFDGGTVVPASASPAVVPEPMSRADAVDPEEAYIAALSSCHMLTFIDLARRAGFVVDAYEDRAEGTMARLQAGRWWIDRVVLRPVVAFSGASLPGDEDVEALHEEAHRLCFIANSVRTEIVIEAEHRTV
jgi:organic hydroperoxide reductase OsmC/OhrA